MKPHFLSWTSVLLLAWLLPAAAQQFSPHIGYVYPAGGQQGTTFQVKLGGQYLDNVTNAFVSGSGLQLKVLDHTKPLTQNQFNALRDELKELQQKRAAAARPARKRGRLEESGRSGTNLTWTVADEKRVTEIRKQIGNFVRRPANPAIAETVTVQVQVTPEAEPGERELRLSTPTGLSNPLKFCIGQLPEFRKQGAKPAGDETGIIRPVRNANEAKAAPPTETPINLPASVNGQILQGGVDRYRFSARQGQHLVAVVHARDLIPYLPDAVPGWFQATLTLLDAKGKELAYDDDFRFHPDPVLHYEITKDGEYMLEIKDAIYRGREDFVYRIEVGELPFLTSIFPLGGQTGTQTSLELKGWNLPATQLTRDNQETTPGIAWVSVRKDERISNRVPFALNSLPEVLEKEPNNLPSRAQAVTLPVIINGRINEPGDRDVFRFEGQAGREVVAEIFARRLDSPLDSVLKLTDATGNQLAFNDDFEDKGSGLNTHHADSYLRATLPADGTYFLQLSDAQGKGGGDYAYRLRLSPPQPDFELRVVPSSLSVRGGACVPFTVYAMRRDGLTNEIALSLVGAPSGFSLSGGRIPAGQDQIRLTLAVPSLTQVEPFTLSLEGRATQNGRELKRPGVPAEDMMQAFAYRHLVPSQELKVEVCGRFMSRSPVRLLDAGAAKIPVGGSFCVHIATPAALGDRVQFELSEPPDGITIQKTTPTRQGTEFTLQSDAAKVKPGLKGNLIISAFATRPAAAGKNKGPANRPRIPVATLPAIPFEVVPQ